MKQKAAMVIRILEENTEKTPKLDYAKPLELLVATILSAQSTDAQINKITPALFERYRSAGDYAESDIRELESLIHSSGFYHSKAKRIKNACRRIVEDFGGRVPDTMEDLVKLPGVGRKTANIVLAHAFGKVEGIAVDTHVARVSQRIGLSKEKDPDKIEQDLLKAIPKEEWHKVNHLLIDHGRNICNAKKPKCPECPLRDLCPSSAVFLDKYYS